MNFGFLHREQDWRLLKFLATRETLIKIAAKVSVSVRRILVELAAHCPFANDIQVITERLSSGQQLIFS